MRAFVGRWRRRRTDRPSRLPDHIRLGDSAGEEWLAARDRSELIEIASTSTNPREHHLIAGHPEAAIVADLAFNESVSAEVIERAVALHPSLAEVFRMHRNAPLWLVESGAVAHMFGSELERYAARFPEPGPIIDYLQALHNHLWSVGDETFTVKEAMSNYWREHPPADG